MKHRARTTRLTVEQCFCLSVVNFRQDGVFAAAHGSRWMLPGVGSENMEFVVREAPGSALTLSFERLGVPARWIWITTTKPHFGGLRYWFKCPVVRDGATCARRVGRLYLPPGCTVFGCRNCYDLTHESAQTHDKRVDKLRRDPAALLSALRSSKHSQNLLGIN